MLIDTINNTSLSKYKITALFIFSSIFFLVLFFGPYFYQLGKLIILDANIAVEEYKTSKIVIGETAFTVFVADTEDKRKKGLSGTEKLDDGRGMLFVFDSENNHGIWMKEMNYSLDIIWINRFSEVVHIEQGVTPETYPTVFYPSKPSVHVVEVNSGVVKDEGIKIGDVLSKI